LLTAIQDALLSSIKHSFEPFDPVAVKNNFNTFTDLSNSSEEPFELEVIFHVKDFSFSIFIKATFG
tara:strand:+ start:167 stop:364 length:198 start_codon:yes stop_codon:yes gene_type:complete